MTLATALAEEPRVIHLDAILPGRVFERGCENSTCGSGPQTLCRNQPATNRPAPPACG